MRRVIIEKRCPRVRIFLNGVRAVFYKKQEWTTMLNYKGYTGHIEFDEEAGRFHGEVLDTKDVVTFQGRSVDDIVQAFRDSVDDYLDFCAEREEKPDKPFSGKFVLRMNPELHHAIHLKAVKAGKSLNKWINDTLQSA